jgi:2-polyprenyl-3-methyl-5-hydroxy-6-metoxy-1,4-benzoquinol methylase
MNATVPAEPTVLQPSTAADQPGGVAQVWGKHWEAFDDSRLESTYQRQTRPIPWYRRPFVSGPHDELAFLRPHLSSFAGLRTLEFGSGIGWTSLWLARAGAQVTVADISPDAVRLSQQAFARAGCHARWYAASVFEPESVPGSYDLVFNSGLIEHFLREQQEELVRNMAQRTKPGGHVAIFAPYAGGRLYAWAKRRMEELGRWRFGDEFPLHTMRDLGPIAGLELIDEQTCKPGDQWNFLAGVHPQLAKLGKLANLLTLGDATPLWRWCLGDSMLSTLFRKPA